MLPTLKSAITPEMDLLEFRRILLDYETGLRWNGPRNFRKSEDTSTSRFNSSPKDKFKSHNSSNNKEASKPPGPCSCGGMHWFRDCPKKASKSNNATSYRGNANRIPITRSKWPHPTDGKQKDGSDNFKNRKEAHMNYVRTEEEDVTETPNADCLPQQHNEGYDELHGILCNNTSAVNTQLQNRHSDKVPTFALARIGQENGTKHQVCIDTGSAISLIDSFYLKKHFPNLKVNAASTIMLKGVGNNQTHGWVNASIYFENTEKGNTCIIGAFHVVTSLATKIILGNDILAEEGASIDLSNGTCSFKHASGIVPITSTKPENVRYPGSPERDYSKSSPSNLDFKHEYRLLCKSRQLRNTIHSNQLPWPTIFKSHVVSVLHNKYLITLMS